MISLLIRIKKVKTQWNDIFKVLEGVEEKAKPKIRCTTKMSIINKRKI